MTILQPFTKEVRKLGYYQVGNQYFLSKLEAYKAAGNDPNSIKYCFNDEIFSSYDWKVEPEPSVGIEEFYRRRAQELRNKYDYIIFLYSGGPDSTNVLDTFVDNGILIDEIVNINSYDRTQVVNGTIHNADYVYNVKPKLDQLVKDKNLQSRITIIDEIDLVKQHWKYYQDSGDWELMFGSVIAPSMFFTKGVWLRYVPRLWNMVVSGKNICVLLGTDKPYLNIDNNKYAIKFSDLLGADSSLLTYNDADLKNLEVQEWFYHSPDCVPLVIKQAHVLKNFVENNRDKNLFTPPDVSTKLLKHNKRSSLVCQSKHVPGNLRYDIFHKLIYPKWCATIVTPKTALLVLRPEDNWWIHQFEESEKKIWFHGLIKTAQEFKNVGFVNKDNKLIGLPLITAEPYYLE